MNLRPYHRFPVCCPVTYQLGDFEGHGHVWNLSLTGWRFSGNLPLRVGKACSLMVNLPSQETIHVAAGIVRWVRDEEDCGIETLAMGEESREEMEVYLWQRVYEGRLPCGRKHTHRLKCGGLSFPVI